MMGGERRSIKDIRRSIKQMEPDSRTLESEYSDSRSTSMGMESDKGMVKSF
jgi:hypothetical protein